MDLTARSGPVSFERLARMVARVRASVAQESVMQPDYLFLSAEGGRLALGGTRSAPRRGANWCAHDPYVKGALSRSIPSGIGPGVPRAHVRCHDQPISNQASRLLPFALEQARALSKRASNCHDGR